MASSELLIQVYKDLADIFERQINANMRDMFLMLAAEACARLGRADEAERLRTRLLRLNPQHMLQGYLSFRDAMRAPVVQQYLDERRKMYPLDRAQQLLDSVRDIPPSISSAPPLLPSDGFSEMTMPPTPRVPPIPPLPVHRIPLPPVQAPGIEATLQPDAEAVDLGGHGEDFSSGLLETPESRAGMRVYRPEDEDNELTAQDKWEGSPTLPPGMMSPLARKTVAPKPPPPPSPPVEDETHDSPTIVPNSVQHRAPTLLPGLGEPAATLRPPPPPPRAPIPAIPALPAPQPPGPVVPPKPVAPLRPVSPPPGTSPNVELPPVTLPPNAMPPRPSALATPPRPPVVPRPVIPAPAPIPAIPAPVVPPVARSAWAEPPTNPFYPQTPPAPATEPEASGNPIIPILLFLVMLLLGLAVLFFAVVQPFVPM